MGEARRNVKHGGNIGGQLVDVDFGPASSNPLANRQSRRECGPLYSEPALHRLSAHVENASPRTVPRIAVNDMLPCTGLKSIPFSRKLLTHQVRVKFPRSSPCTTSSMSRASELPRGMNFMTGFHAGLRRTRMQKRTMVYIIHLGSSCDCGSCVLHKIS